MAMGKRRGRGRQPSMWVSSSDLPRSAGHPFYERLNRVLDAAGFDAFVEEQCAKFYADGVGRPSLAPGRYFRMLLLGYFEGLDSERAIAWRAADSLSLRQFLDVSLDAAPPDHSTVSRTRRRIDVETHLAVFTWVLQRLADAGLVGGKTVGIDATTLEANAALRSIVRRDTGAGYETFLRQLAAASGIATPTRAELARLDRKRPKKGSNDDWTHPKDPDAKITKMKDGRTRLAHKAEHAVDLETGAVVGVSVQDADAGDTQTMLETLVTAAEQVDAVLPAGPGIAELVCDKGYHSNQTLVTLAEVEIRSYVSEPDRGRRNWRGKHVARDAVYANRRRIRGARGKRLLRRRGERLERPNAYLYATGGMRRVHLRGHGNILKRLLLQVCGLNLGLLMRQLTRLRDAARPPGPRLCPRRRLAARIAPLLGPRIAPSGPHAGKLDRPVVDSSHDTDSFAHSARAARRQFCHSLLGARGESPAAFDRPCIRHRNCVGPLNNKGVTYAQYAPSSRLVSPAPDRSRCDAGFHHGLLAEHNGAGRRGRGRHRKCELYQLAARPRYLWNVPSTKSSTPGTKRTARMVRTSATAMQM